MNKKFHKSHRSQAALEFLTTYAWAFLVILIMISALAYFGILNPSKLLPDRCNFGAEIGCEDFRITYGTGSDGTLDLRLKNNVGEPITISASSVTSEAKTVYTCTVPSGPTLGTGDITDLQFTGCNSEDAGLVKGEKTKVEITVTYYATKSGSTYTHEVAGDIFTTVT